MFQHLNIDTLLNLTIPISNINNYREVHISPDEKVKNDTPKILGMRITETQ